MLQKRLVEDNHGNASLCHQSKSAFLKNVFLKLRNIKCYGRIVAALSDFQNKRQTIHNSWQPCGIYMLQKQWLINILETFAPGYILEENS